MATVESNAEEKAVGTRRLTGIICLCAAAALLTLAGIFPLPCAALSLAAAPLLFLSGKLHFVCPPALLALYGALSLSFNFDLLTLIAFLSLCAAYAAAVTLVKKDSLILSGGVSALAAVAAGLLVCGAACAVNDVTPDKLCRDYVAGHGQNVVIVYAAEKYFDSLEIDDAPEKGTEEYGERALTAYAEYFRQTMATDFVYHITNFCALSALLLVCGSNIARSGTVAGSTARKQSKERLSVLSEPESTADMPQWGAQADDAHGEENALSEEHAAAARLSRPFSEARLGRVFLWSVFLPVLAFSVLGLIDFMQPVTATAFNLLVFLPCLIEGAALLCYAVSLFKGKPRVIAFAVAAIVIAGAVYVPIVSMVVSPLGFCDSLVNLRKLFDIAAK